MARWSSSLLLLALIAILATTHVAASRDLLNLSPSATYPCGKYCGLGYQSCPDTSDHAPGKVTLEKGAAVKEIRCDGRDSAVYANWTTSGITSSRSESTAGQRSSLSPRLATSRQTVPQSATGPAPSPRLSL